MKLRLAFALLLLVFALPASAASQQKVASLAAEKADKLSSSEEQIAVALISRHRAAHGLAPVRLDRALSRPAAYQAHAVATAGTLSHGDFAGRMTAFGVRGKAAENLSAGLARVEQVIAQWQGSAGHNANLLVPEFSRIGLARVIADRPYWALVLAR